MKQYWKAYEKVPVVILLILSFLLSSCAAVDGIPYVREVPSNVPTFDTTVYYIAEGTVMRGIQQALNGAAGTGIYANGDKYIFVWSLRNVGVGFFGINAQNKDVFDVFKVISQGGNLTSAKNITDLLNTLKDNGWAKVSLTSVPPALSALVKGIPGIIESMGGKLRPVPLFLVLPAPMPDNQDLDQWIDCSLLQKCQSQS